MILEVPNKKGMFSVFIFHDFRLILITYCKQVNWELIYQRVKGRVNSASAVSFPSHLQKGYNYCLDNAAEKMIRDHLHFPGDPVNC